MADRNNKHLFASLAARAGYRFFAIGAGGFVNATALAWLVLVASALVRGRSPESAWNPATPATLLVQSAQAGFQAALPAMVLLLVTMGLIAARNRTKASGVLVASSSTATLIAFILAIFINSSEPYLAFAFTALTYWAVCGLLFLWLAKKVFPKLR